MNWKTVLSFFALAASLFAHGAQAQAVQDYLPVDDAQALSFCATCVPIETGTFLPPAESLLFLNDWYDQQEPVISFFSTYSLTPEEQGLYLSLIQQFWPGVYDNMQPWEINDDMADVINSMLTEIIYCSQAMSTVHGLSKALTKFLTGGMPKTIGSWAKFVWKRATEISDAMNKIQTNRMYRSCITVASANWRTEFEMAYGQYWWY